MKAENAEEEIETEHHVSLPSNEEELNKYLDDQVELSGADKHQIKEEIIKIMKNRAH